MESNEQSKVMGLLATCHYTKFWNPSPNDNGSKINTAIKQ
jgi:hypothetical protein